MLSQRARNALAVPDTLASMAGNSASDSPMSAKIISLTAAACPAVDVLTARMKAGDEEAFRSFHDFYCDRLFRYLIVLCRGDEGLTRDLLQTTMLKVVRSIRLFTDETEFWNWLAVIARNSFFDHVRRSRRAPQFEAVSPEHPVRFEPPAPDDTLLFEALERALEQLPADERDLIESFYFESGSYRSVAAERDASPKAIESRLGRIRQKLRGTILKFLHHENS